MQTRSANNDIIPEVKLLGFLHLISLAMKCLCVVFSVQLLSSIVILSYNEENKVLRVHYITEYYKYDLNFSWDEKKSKEKKTHKEQNTGRWQTGDCHNNDQFLKISS